MSATAKSWILFIGVVLLILGIFGTLRTAINISVLDKYPTAGVLNINPFVTVPTYMPRESDCYYLSAPIYDPSGNPIPGQDAQSLTQQENCLKGIEEDRKNAKVNDISRSLLFLLLGIGILSCTKFLDKLAR